MDLEVRHLKLIAAVADYGGLTQAGHRLHLTQSALSHQLRDIEDKLGLRLFLRMRKKMPLTPAGERLLRSARLVLDEMRRAEEDLRQTASGREGVLRLSTECNTCYHWLPSRLRLFRRRLLLRQPAGAPGGLQHLVVRQQARQFADRLGMVVHAQVNVAVRAE